MNAPFGIAGRGLIQRTEAREAVGFLPRGWIDGLTLSNDGTDATNDVGIAAGSARSTVRIVDGEPSTLTRDQMDLDLPIAIIKQLDVAFAPENYDIDGYSGGDRSGGRSSSALSNTTWHALLAGGPGLQTDVFFHDAATQASILAEMQKIGGYTAYRHIGSVIRSGAVILPFTQRGDDFELVTPIQDVNGAPPSTNAQTVALSVPTGIVVLASVTAYQGGSGDLVYLSSLTQTDSAPSLIAAPLATGGALAAVPSIGPKQVWTNTLAQIRYRSNDTGIGLHIVTHSWRHLRGKDS